MAPLATFLESRERLRERRVGDGGREVCHELTSRLDAAIVDLFEEAGAAEDCAIVAIGGYGRAELSPYSDVDLMVLHGMQDPSEVAASLFRPLWDAGLRLGHSVRTVKEAGSSARERFETHTTLLTSRLVAGSEALYRQFSEKIASVTRARPLTRYLLADERERRAEAPYLLMATNVKTGRGGLRTLQAFDWERRREEMIGRFGPEMTDEEEIARESLLRVRNALHVVTGRPHDVFTPELREPAARWLGTDTYELGSMLVRAMRIVDRLATERWSDLVEVSGSTSRWSRGRREAPTSAGDRFPTVSEFVTLLDGGEQGRVAVERVMGSGEFGGLLPEWEIVNVAPQLAPFHEHPTTDHLWRAVEEMKALIDGDDPHFRGIATEVGSRAPLLLAAFLHDIGKGQGEDHSAVGADVARRFCQRLGADPGLTSLVERAVRHHLLLSRSATRRDLDDPAVIEEVTQSVGDLTSLQVLYLLTVADSKATGTTMWTPWRATLIRTLFLRCAARFGADRSHEAGATREQVLELAAGQAALVESHLELMPADYLRSVDPEDVLWHVDLMETRGEVANLGIRQGPGAQTVVVVGPRRTGFRRLVAESFAANGMDVLAARLNTRADGMVVDTFQVRDDVTGAAVPEKRWLRARSDVIAALSGELDTGSKVAAREAAYGSGDSAGAAPVVQVSVDNASGETVVTVRATDRIGRLAEILSGLSSCGLEIRLALLDSRGGEIVDTFHVSGPRPRDEAAIRHLEHRIAASIAR